MSCSRDGKHDVLKKFNVQVLHALHSTYTDVYELLETNFVLSGHGIIYRALRADGCNYIVKVKKNITQEQNLQVCQELHVYKKAENTALANCIPKLLGYHLVDNGRLCVFVTKDEGVDLNRFINAKPDFLSEQEIIEIFLSITDCVDALHDLGFVHCDIKPENVLISRSNNKLQCKLIDFETTTYMGSFFFGGTLEYMSPEMFTTTNNTRFHPQKNFIPTRASKSIDYWSMGVLLYCITFNELPFQSEKENFADRCDEIATKVRLHRITPQSNDMCEMYKNVNNVIHNLLHAKADDRSNDVRNLAEKNSVHNDAKCSLNVEQNEKEVTSVAINSIV